MCTQPSFMYQIHAITIFEPLTLTVLKLCGFWQRSNFGDFQQFFIITLD